MKRFWPVWLAVLLVLMLLGSALFVTRTSAAGQKYRWDIISVDFAAASLSAGGFASAIANDSSSITLTGEGTGNATARGTYQVTGFVSFTVAPGTSRLPNDNIGNIKDQRGGLLFVTIQYSDGSPGVLAVSCDLLGTPDSVFEGIRVSKGFVDYWNGTAPVGGVNGNRTNFHILP